MNDVGSQLLDLAKVEDRAGQVIAHRDHDGVLRKRSERRGDEIGKDSVVPLVALARVGRDASHENQRGGRRRPASMALAPGKTPA